ncbi:hypothetical protein HXZ79_10020 [Acinetobacter indicus]|uniref:hypothetical protein n=1 Tax=Acinetobacter indicus TaxID=756892 RepID=UPI0025758E3C|nr:hypothetical protein [Acinetobacter indicus]MDM1311588.1 hypothetical protein [Acinetobacter indicus]
MKKFELINKSIFIISFFSLLVFWSYVQFGYLKYLLASIFLGCIFLVLGRNNYKKYYFKYVLLIFSIILFYSFGAIYLTVKNGWFEIFVCLLVFIVIDLYLSIGKIKDMQHKYKNNSIIDDNLDQFSCDFELANGKVWGDGRFFKIIFVSYVFVIGPYFIILNPLYRFDAGEMMNGIKSNLYMYAVILLILVVWEYTLKRIYFFSGLEYKFKNE